MPLLPGRRAPRALVTVWVGLRVAAETASDISSYFTGCCIVRLAILMISEANSAVDYDLKFTWIFPSLPPLALSVVLAFMMAALAGLLRWVGETHPRLRVVAAEDVTAERAITASSTSEGDVTVDSAGYANGNGGL